MPPDPLTLSAAEQARNVAIPMMTERGRGLVLVGTARLDLALEHVLKAVMAPCSDPDDKLFTPDRSLGSYGAKINLAARLGLIDASIEQALHVIRRVRNDFAHSAGEPSLTEPRHQTRLQRVYSEAERSPPWWHPSKPAHSSNSLSRLGPPCVSATPEPQVAEGRSLGRSAGCSVDRTVELIPDGSCSC